MATRQTKQKVSLEKKQNRCVKRQLERQRLKTQNMYTLEQLQLLLKQEKQRLKHGPSTVSSKQTNASKPPYLYPTDQLQQRTTGSTHRESEKANKNIPSSSKRIPRPQKSPGESYITTPVENFLSCDRLKRVFC